MTSFMSSAQIVTSKKEAQKKGIYSYNDQPAYSNSFNNKPVAKKAPAEVNDRPLVVTESDLALLTTGKPLVASEPAKESRKGGPNKTEAPAKRKKSALINEEIDPDYTPDTAPETYLAQQIVNNAMQFEGVSYRGGGTSKAGMDCSGMVFATFKIFDITLPRSSSEMAKVGRVVDSLNIQKGDLVFFKNNHNRNSINHVGIVVDIAENGEVKFLHSATHGGVLISSLKEAYYERTFVQANRVLEE